METISSKTKGISFTTYYYISYLHMNYFFQGQKKKIQNPLTSTNNNPLFQAE